jgi:uncharacterized protein YyaL (SSP411 family)
MIRGLCAAYQAVGEPRWLTAARRAADFLGERLTAPGGGMLRAWKDGQAKVPGFLDDHAFFAEASLDLYESGGEKRDLDRAFALCDRMLAEFWEDGFYFTPRSGERLVHRPRAPHDNAWPSGTSAAAFALLRLHALGGPALYRQRAEELFRMYGAAAAHNPFGFSHLLAALELARRGSVEVVLAGDRQAAAPLVECVHRIYHPSRVLCFAEDAPIGEGRAPVAGRPAAYVCRERVCQAPVTGPEELARALGNG